MPDSNDGLGRCSTCKHWGHSRNHAEDEGSRLKSCIAPLIEYGYLVGNDDVADNGALVEDDEGWGMLTAPSFGCVLHESK